MTVLSVRRGPCGVGHGVASPAPGVLLQGPVCCAGLFILRGGINFSCLKVCEMWTRDTNVVICKM